MAKRRGPINPFYPLLVVFGVVFFVTACAYGLMAFRAVSGPAGADADSALLIFLKRNGAYVLGAELALLAAASLAAMGTDSYWTRRRSVHHPHSDSDRSPNDLPDDRS